MEQNKKSKHSGVRHFVMNVISSTIGVIIGVTALVIIGVVILFAILGSHSSSSKISDNSILKIELNGLLTEQQQDNLLGSILSTQNYTSGLDNMLTAIRIAKDDKRIKALLLEAGIIQGGPASLQELRKALKDFKKSGKPIYAYGDNYTQGCYYVCSIADKVVLNPIGQVEWRGLSAQTIFYTDFMAKLGVKMQVFKVGTYKSAVEPFTQTEMSLPNRKQVTSFLNDIWQNILDDVSHSRRIEKDSLNAMADCFTGLASTNDVLNAGLVDTLMYKDDFSDFLKKKIHADAQKPLPTVDATTLCEQSKNTNTTAPAIAVYFAEGDIVDYKELGFGAESCIAPKQVTDDLAKLGNDKSIKAVVLRINSSGGSAYASEQIWHSVEKLSKKKPVIISMGAMAASGAYYISCAGQHIFAEPTTLTGSIGIFGVIPDLSKLLNEKLSLHFDMVKTNSLSDMGNITRPFNNDEQKLIQTYVNNGYRLFLTRVAHGRHKTLAQADSLAQGRVWTGRQALSLGLVDKLGGLQDAIAYAARKAGLKSNCPIRRYPESQPWYTDLGFSEAQQQVRHEQLRSTLGQFYEPYLALQRLKKQNRIQARLPCIINIQ